MTHICPAAETATHSRYHTAVSVDGGLCGYCRWQISFPGVTRTLSVCLHLASRHGLLQNWCTSLTQQKHWLSWTCSRKGSPCRPVRHGTSRLLLDATLPSVTSSHLLPMHHRLGRSHSSEAWHASCLVVMGSSFHSV